MRGGLGDRGKGGGRRVINALVINKRERGEEVSLLRARLLTTVVEISFVGCAARSLRNTIAHALGTFRLYRKAEREERYLFLLALTFSPL